MFLSDKEKKLISDSDFLISKIKIIEKIYSLFEDVRVELNRIILTNDFKFPKNVDTDEGKIFRGENYKSLPYVVLDYPKYFSNKDTFAFRTMFWWGNFFSTTLHLEGISFQKYSTTINEKSEGLLNKEIHLCVNSTPWEYDYSKDNYILLDDNNLDMIENVSFLKLSKKYKLNSYNELPINASTFLSECIQLLD